jgi:mRNA interferase MazF
MIADWQTAGLLKASVIKPVITTIQKDLVIQKLGRLTLPDCKSLENLIIILLKP